jgi:hypothetical protein
MRKRESSTRGNTYLGMKVARMKKIYVSFLIMTIVASLCLTVTPLAEGVMKTKPPIPPGKNKAPEATITNPPDGAIVSGVIAITVEASDKEDGQLVADIYIDGVFIIHSNTYDWNTTASYDGTHIISALATDTSGQTNSDTISAFTNNGIPPPPPPPEVEHYALIVGISDYEYMGPDSGDLRYCDEDAVDWYNYFTDIGYEHIMVLGDHTSDYPKYDGLATKINIVAELQNLAASKDNDDVIAFIFSGHGAASSKSTQYICAWDSDPVAYDNDISDVEFASTLEGTEAGRIFIFLDSCYSGGFIPELESSNPIGSVYVTTTSTAKGYGYDEPTYQNGAWTWWFLEHTLVQRFNSNSHTTMEYAFDYAYENYPYKGRNDRPQEWDEDPSSMFFLL